ncbi:MAG: hypothetical protein J5921_04155, partial [Clostridia bacterium]|nr:hypothetical protein [Clostridia bacterium]
GLAMAAAWILGASTCASMIISILFFPRIHVGKLKTDSYWIITLIGAALVLLTGTARIGDVARELTANTPINPLKILVLFISMTVLSVFLDEVGFFSFIAAKTLRAAKSSQFTLFSALYIAVSILTVFTSNDIIILTFTPFICYFAKNAGISPVPYLFAEFIAANTWSMALIIGNPTNIYLSTAGGIGFAEYVKVMILPTIAAGVVSYLTLLLLFRKKLSEKITVSECEASIKDRPLLITGLIHLGLCTVLLAVSSYIGFEMWYVALGFALSLFVFTLIFSAARKKKPVELGACLKRAPWQLIPFVLSMFVIILALEENGVVGNIAGFLGTDHTVFKYGAASFLSSNVINNIPMSVLFSSVTGTLEGSARTGAIFASVVGSNIGAFLTPIGALAGMMWSSILKSHGVKFSFVKFVKYGAAAAVPTLAAALLVLFLTV